VGFDLGACAGLLCFEVGVTDVFVLVFRGDVADHWRHEFLVIASNYGDTIRRCRCCVGIYIVSTQPHHAGSLLVPVFPALFLLYRQVRAGVLFFLSKNLSCVDPE